MARHCSVVGGHDCRVPANLQPAAARSRAGALSRCRRCGEDVCRSPGCSLMAPPPRGKEHVRMCINCLIDNLGDDRVHDMIAAAYQAEEAAQRIEAVIRRAIYDPGVYVSRGTHTDGDPDELHVWQAKAVRVALEAAGLVATPEPVR